MEWSYCSSRCFHSWGVLPKFLNVDVPAHIGVYGNLLKKHPIHVNWAPPSMTKPTRSLYQNSNNNNNKKHPKRQAHICIPSQCGHPQGFYFRKVANILAATVFPCVPCLVQNHIAVASIYIFNTYVKFAYLLLTGLVEYTIIIHHTSVMLKCPVSLST